MWTKFTEGVGDKLAELWSSRALMPAFLFWAMGALLLFRAEPGVRALASSFVGWATLVQAAALLACVVVIAASSAVVILLTGPLLRVLEGYPVPGLRDYFESRRASAQARRTKAKHRCDVLASHFENGTATTVEKQEYAKLQFELARRWPPDGEVMPTRIGNILRAAETRTFARYGLDSVDTWPALWLVLPDDARQRLVDTQAPMLDSIGLMIWSLLAAAVWARWSLWALLALLVVPVAYRRLVVATTSFADAFMATFDVHRFRLYKALAFPRPLAPASERESGELLTRFLREGIDVPGVVYKPGEPDDGTKPGGAWSREDD